jgi:hypothetical protein
MLGFGSSLALHLISCAWVGNSLWDDRLDVDGDGVPWPEDCDDADESATSNVTWFLDADADGYGDPDVPSEAKQCHRPDGYAGNSDDCDDADVDAHPGALWYADLDADDYGDASSAENPPSSSCERPAGLWTARPGDCDDDDPAVSPAAIEICDGVDSDCDGLSDLDEGDLPVAVWCRDDDGDGFGADASKEKSCEWHDAPWSNVCGDCDDAAPTINPSGLESCDGVDQDCDDDIDEDASDLQDWCLDADRDGYGDPSTAVSACAPDPGYGADCTDCDDTVGAIYPGAKETCVSSDDDCDGTADAVGPDATWSCDHDGDEIGGEQTESGCTVPVGGCVGTWVRDGGDCDDADVDVSPRADEDLKNGVDDDCDGKIDLRWTSGLVDLLDAGAIEFDGGSEQAWVGCAFAPGDYDGDGEDDMAVSGCSTAAQGAAYLIAGGGDAWRKGGTLEAGSDWPRFVGEYYEMTGRAMAGGVDLTGDGCDDLVLGAPSYNVHDEGRAVILPGCDAVAFAAGDWDAATTIDGDALWAAGGGSVAASVDAATGDSVLVVTGPVYAGVAWLFESPIPSGALSTGDAPVEIIDNRFPYVGVGASSALADFDSNGLLDLALGTPGVVIKSGGGGVVYFVEDPITTAAGTVELGTVVSNSIPSGPATKGFFGENMAVLGDLDGDGYDEFAVQSEYVEGYDFSGRYIGILSLFSGSSTFMTASMTADADRIAWFSGTVSGDGVGTRMTTGDVDGDGSLDLLIGAGWGDTADAPGQAWLYYNAGELSGSYTIDAAAPSSDATFMISGSTDGRIGRAVALADMDDDGLDDVWIGSQAYPDWTSDATGEPGAAFLLLSAGSP